MWHPDALGSGVSEGFLTILVRAEPYPNVCCEAYGPVEWLDVVL